MTYFCPGTRGMIVNLGETNGIPNQLCHIGAGETLDMLICLPDMMVVGNGNFTVDS